MLRIHMYNHVSRIISAALIIVFTVFYIYDPLFTPAVFASSAGSFTMRPTDARAFGMGSAVSSVYAYGSNSYWNPACLGFVRTSDISSMQSTILGDVNYLYVGYNHLAEPSFWDIAWGVNIVNARVDGLKEAKYDDASNSAWLTGDEFGYYGTAYVLSGAKTFGPKISVGMNLKQVQQVLFNNSSSGIGLDAGVLWRFDRRTTFGFTWQNMIAPQLAWDTSSKLVETMPGNMIAGVSYMASPKLMLVGDVNMRSDRGLEARVGGEYQLTDYFALRAGYEQQRIVFGMSVMYHQFGVHYAFAPEQVGEITDAKHYISISYALEEWNVSEPEPEEEALFKAKTGQGTSTEIAGPKPAPATEAAPPADEDLEIAMDKMSVTLHKDIVQTVIRYTNTGEATAQVRTNLSIYDKNMQLIELFASQPVIIAPHDTAEIAFDWKPKPNQQVGTYYIKARYTFDGQERSVLKKVVRE